MNGTTAAFNLPPRQLATPFVTDALPTPAAFCSLMLFLCVTPRDQTFSSPLQKKKKTHKTKRDKNSVCPLSFLQCNVWAAPRWMMYVQSLSQGEEGEKKGVSARTRSGCTKCKFALSDASGGQTNQDCICEGGGETSWLLNVFTYCKSF